MGKSEMGKSEMGKSEMGKSEMGKSEMGKAARLRRLWRSQDARVQASGLARARPAPAPPARDDGPGSRGLTARELINMARAARAGAARAAQD